MLDIVFNFFPDFETIYLKVFGRFSKPLTLIINILLILLITRILILLLRKILKIFITRKIKKGGNEKKLNTIMSVLRNVLGYLVYFFACVAVLNELRLGTTVTSLLATAGIGGLAIGFGAQSLIKDVISGAFLLFEQQIAVGDYVTISDITGTIEEIQLRITKVRAYGGELYIVPNGQITTVTNYSKGNNMAIVDVPMPYEQKVEDIYAILRQAMKKMSEENALLIGSPEIAGVVDFDNSAMMIRIIAKCRSMEHFGVERQIRRAVIDAFHEQGISFPYNRVVVLQHE